MSFSFGWLSMHVSKKEMCSIVLILLCSNVVSDCRSRLVQRKLQSCMAAKPSKRCILYRKYVLLRMLARADEIPSVFWNEYLLRGKKEYQVVVATSYR